MRFKHVFVTGATGIVGIPLCRKLSEMGIRVTAYSRSSGDLDLPSGVNHVKGDIQHPVVLAGAAQVLAVRIGGCYTERCLPGFLHEFQYAQTMVNPPPPTIAYIGITGILYRGARPIGPVATMK